MSVRPNGTCTYCGGPVIRTKCSGSGDCSWGEHDHIQAVYARPLVTEADLEAAYEKVRAQMARKLEKHGPGAYISRHEAYGIIAEEHKELLDAIHANDDDAYEAELLDIVGAAIFAVASRSVV